MFVREIIEGTWRNPVGSGIFQATHYWKCECSTSPLQVTFVASWNHRHWGQSHQQNVAHMMYWKVDSQLVLVLNVFLRETKISWSFQWSRSSDLVGTWPSYFSFAVVKVPFWSWLVASIRPARSMWTVRMMLAWFGGALVRFILLDHMSEHVSEFVC